MAKDGDIIEVMFGWIIELIGWIIKILIKLLFALTVGLFTLIASGIKALFSKNDNIEQ